MQFDVFVNPSPRMRTQYPYVVDIQSNLLSGLSTRMVAPLAITALEDSDLPSRLCPVFTISNQRLMFVPYEAAPLPKKLLRKRVVSLKHSAPEIIAAVDVVLSGV